MGPATTASLTAAAEAVGQSLRFPLAAIAGPIFWLKATTQGSWHYDAAGMTARAWLFSLRLVKRVSLGATERVGLLGSPGDSAPSRPPLPGQLLRVGPGAAALLLWGKVEVFDHSPGAQEAGYVAGLGLDSGATKSKQERRV